MTREQLEMRRLQRAVQIARDLGEHYPTCDPPEPTVKLGLTDEWRAWNREHRPRDRDRPFCTCWKAQMEAALLGKGE